MKSNSDFINDFKIPKNRHAAKAVAREIAQRGGSFFEELARIAVADEEQGQGKDMRSTERLREISCIMEQNKEDVWLIERLLVETLLLEDLEIYDSRIRSLAQMARIQGVLSSMMVPTAEAMEEAWEVWGETADMSKIP